MQKLIALKAKEAMVVRDGVEQKIPLKNVVVNDEIIVKSGNKVPVDGVIISGQCIIDESMISSEAIPIQKRVYDNVIGATIVQSGVFHMRATNVDSNTILAQIIKMVEDAQGSQAPIQRISDRVAGIFVPIVILIAVLTFSFWYFLAPTMGLLSSDVSALSFAIYAMTSVFIIACPCALGLATPTAIIVGIGAAAKKGILIKDAAAIEKTHKIKSILIDKTGTVTEGKPIVQDVKYFNDKKHADALAYTLEKKSDHPLANSIIIYLSKQVIDEIKLEDFTNINGVGVSGLVDRHKVAIVKSDSLAKYSSLNSEVQKVLDNFEDKGFSIAGLIENNKVIALYGVADKVKFSSKDAIADLHANDISVTMLTGDHKRAAQIIAESVDIDEVIANVLLADKERIVREKRKSLQKNQFVAMVGDGINDAPALARADVGIAMGTGTDIAIEAGDIVIIKGSLSKVTQAINISEHTLKTIKQNLFWAFGYNIIAIPVAAGILYPIFGITLSPIIASTAMAFSSVSVVMNSLRLRFL